jgi:alpha-ribazole phosphatase
MKTIWLLRHGETEFNVEGRLQGTTNSPLTTLGLTQISSLAKFFSEIELDSAFSSDLMRAQITAQSIVAGFSNLSLKCSELLRERCFGIFEGKSYIEYRNHAGTKHETLEFKPEQGESLAEVNSRALAAIKLLRSSKSKNILAVGHGSFNRCFLTMAAQLPLSNVFSIKQANCCVNKLIEQPGGSFSIEMLNFIGHLED